jgi:hypothetical protein
LQKCTSTWWNIKEQTNERFKAKSKKSLLFLRQILKINCSSNLTIAVNCCNKSHGKEKLKQTKNNIVLTPRCESKKCAHFFISGSSLDVYIKTAI